MNSPCKNLFPPSSRRRRGAALCISVLALLGTSCDSDKGKGASQAPASSALAQEPSPVPDPSTEKAAADQKEWAVAKLRKEANRLYAESSFDAALIKVNEGLALDPQHSDFLRLKREIGETLAHRCCGKWQRYDFTQPGAAKKDLHGVLWSEELGPNHRGHLFRGRVLLACGKGTLSMRLRVPWQVPESPTTTLEFTLGESKGSEKVKTDAAPFIYEFPEPKKWLQKLAENENQTFEVRVPKADGTQGKFTFELGQAKTIADEVLSVCK